MELKDYIQSYPLFNPQQVSAFLRTFSNNENFLDARVVINNEEIVDKKQRTVKVYHLGKQKTLTETHWVNLICFALKNYSNIYFKERSIPHREMEIESMQLLKYPEGGFYTKHVDSGGVKRELSAIIFLNNDFEGGKLQFFKPNHKELILEVTPEPGQLYLWPSNFLFPHQATKVTKGIRYSIVSWMY